MTSHGSESKFGAINELDKELKNKEAWARSAAVYMESKELRQLVLPATNKCLSTDEAAAFDYDNQVSDELDMLMTAGNTGATSRKYKGLVAAAKANQTPMKKQGETDAKMQERTDQEARTAAWGQAMESVDSVSRGHFLKIRWFIDPATGRVEARAARTKRMAAWGVVCRSLDKHHSTLLNATEAGNFAALIEKIMRQETSETQTTKLEVLEKMMNKEKGSLNVDGVFDFFAGMEEQYANKFGEKVNEELMREMVLGCIEKDGNGIYQEMIDTWKMSEIIKGWDNAKLKTKLLEVEAIAKKRMLSNATQMASRGETSEKGLCFFGENCSRATCTYKHPNGRKGKSAQGDASKADRGRRKETRRCYKCQEIGHLADGCKNKRVSRDDRAGSSKKDAEQRLATEDDEAEQRVATGSDDRTIDEEDVGAWAAEVQGLMARVQAQHPKSWATRSSEGEAYQRMSRAEPDEDDEQEDERAPQLDETKASVISPSVELEVVGTAAVAEGDDEAGTKAEGDDETGTEAEGDDEAGSEAEGDDEAGTEAEGDDGAGAEAEGDDGAGAEAEADNGAGAEAEGDDDDVAARDDYCELCGSDMVFLKGSGHDHECGAVQAHQALRLHGLAVPRARFADSMMDELMFSRDHAQKRPFLRLSVEYECRVCFNHSRTGKYGKIDPDDWVRHTASAYHRNAVEEAERVHDYDEDDGAGNEREGGAYGERGDDDPAGAGIIVGYRWNAVKTQSEAECEEESECEGHTCTDPSATCEHDTCGGDSDQGASGGRGGDGPAAGN